MPCIYYGDVLAVLLVCGKKALGLVTQIYSCSEERSGEVGEEGREVGRE